MVDEILEVNCFDSDICDEAQVLIEPVLFQHVYAPCVRCLLIVK